ncbi:ankyrin repeat protein [Pandoravirus inopinatum]|uniref:Ankyrin repeat protein n=1 Tax=Pandoravirus inopinatum TaxID=1605721 RepID=A0A0B5J7P5_9VIRU|nr:ankyrin repeat protein [Pandoravirus inopinatum]AJF96771.1 ankyrin repeat protein [Pandoravirus inopinatum]
MAVRRGQPSSACAHAAGRALCPRDGQKVDQTSRRHAALDTHALDLGVFLANKWAARAMDDDAMRAVAERVSAASGFDITTLFQRSAERIHAGEEGPRAALEAVRTQLAPPQETDPAQDELAQEAMADPSGASTDTIEAAWQIVRRGGLTALRERYGDETVAIVLNRVPDYYLRVINMLGGMLTLCTDGPLSDMIAANLSWPSLYDDVMWLHMHAVTAAMHNSAINSIIIPMLRVTMAFVGRHDLMAQLGDDTEDTDRSASQTKLTATSVGRMYPYAAIAALGRGDLITARWACARMGAGDARAAWTAWRDGNADAARFLYAHGCDRAAKIDRPHDACAKSPLYVSLCTRDTEAIRALLDRTAADDSYRDAVNQAIAVAVAQATGEALADGNLRVVMWLHRRYKDIVDAVLADARAARVPMLIPVRADA